jgi:hypothetical protein
VPCIECNRAIKFGDLLKTARELGAQVLALQHEYHAIDTSISIEATGMLMFSKPNGLRPHAPRVEDLGGAVEAIRIGIASFLRHRARIDGLRAGAEPFTVVGDLVPNFRESCLSTCVMAQWCRERVAGRVADMGDGAREALGDVSIAHVVDLMNGTVLPATEHERIIAQQLRDIAAQHGVGRAA